MLLARSEESAQRFYSMSAQIRQERQAYYEILAATHLLNGLEGKLTSSKWAKIAQCSQDTALRDIEDLVRKGVLAKDSAGGRSTSYSLVEFTAFMRPP